MTDPQIICTNCGTEIKLTESLAAPIIAAARKQLEAQLAAKEADFGRREAHLHQRQDDLAKARGSLDEQVATMVSAERATIAEAEARKARLALADDLGQRDQQLADLQQMLAANNAKLAERPVPCSSWRGKISARGLLVRSGQRGRRPVLLACHAACGPNWFKFPTCANQGV